MNGINFEERRIDVFKPRLVQPLLLQLTHKKKQRNIPLLWLKNMIIEHLPFNTEFLQNGASNTGRRVSTIVV
uniref:Uncharacterized protein n=1 Tax=Sphingobacterium sp. (strain 21) TaxID=743722 RepID=F4C507_SPHS2